MGLSRSSCTESPRFRAANPLLRVVFLLLACLLLIGTCAAQKLHPPSSKSQAQKQEEAFRTHFELAHASQTSGDQKHAVTEYKLFLAEALRRVASLRARLGKFQEAQTLLEAGLTLSPENADLLLDFSAMRLEQNNLADAKSLAEKALQVAPKSARAEYLLGNTLCQQNDYAAAKQHLEAAVVGAPNFETGYLLGLTYLKLKDLAHAEMLFKDMEKGLGDTAKLHISFGRAYRNGGFVERSVEELKKAVALDPTEPQVHYFLGLAYLGRDGDSGFPQAAPEFREELKRHPDDYRSHYLLGYILLKQHNLVEAETELKRAATLDPRSPDPLIYLGQLYSETNRPQQAEAAFRKAIVLTKDISRNNYQINRAHYLLGRILLQRGKTDEGKQEMRLSAELSKKSVELARQRIAGDAPNLSGEELSAQQDMVSATPEELRRTEAYVNDLKPAIADSYNNLGVIAASGKDFVGALEFFHNAAEWQPSLATLDRNLGMAAFYANQFDQAIPPLNRHLQAHADDTRARAALGLSLFALQKYEAVRSTLRPIEVEVDADPGLKYAYAVSQLKSGDYNQGFSRLRALESANSNSADLHVLLGEALAEQADWAAALQEYRKALAIDPKQARIHFLTGLAFIRQGSPADGAQEMRAALQINPSDVSSKYHLAFALLEIDKKDEAMGLLREVLQQDPKHADAYYQLGKLQLERGDTKSAISNLEAGTKFKPDSDYIHYQLAMAYRRDSRTEDARRELKLYQALKSRHRGRNGPQTN
jgi:tetratricopeptide (TPR) repeat protein